MSNLPPLFLSTRAMLRPNATNGAESVTQGHGDQQFDVVFDRAADYGINAVITIGEGSLMRPLMLAHRHHGIAIYPIIPNIPSYVREASNYGLVGAGIRRLRRLGLPNLVRLGCSNAGKALKVLQHDFNTLMSILFDVEMAEFRQVNPSVVFLDGQITDLCLAFGNKDLLVRFADTIRGRYNAEPGLVTNNLGTLVPALRRWSIPIQLLVAPFNREGFAMKPDRISCESLLGDRRFKVIADRISVETKPSAETYRYLRERGVGSAVLDVIEEEDMRLASRMYQPQDYPLAVGLGA